MKKYHHFLVLVGLLFSFSSINAQTMACLANVTALVNGNSQVTIFVEDVLDSPAIPGFVLEISTPDSIVASGTDQVTFTVNQTTNFTYEVQDLVTGNTCWGQLTVINQNCVDTLFVELEGDEGVDQLELNVNALNASDLSSLQFTLIYDGALLEFKEVVPGALNVSSANFNNMDSGILNYAWFDPSGGSVAFPGGTNLYTIIFDVLENGVTDIYINDLSDVDGDGTGDGLFPEAGNAANEAMCINSNSTILSANGAKVEGRIARNENIDCSGNTQIGLYNWIVEVSNAQNTYYTNTDENGFYKRIVQPGDYNVKAYPFTAAWGFCNNDEAVSLPNIGDEAIANFDAKAEALCPHMTVSLSTPFLRRCFSNTYYVAYCNQGTEAAEDAYVEVELDNDLIFLGSPIPHTQNGQIVTFDLGTVDLGCFDFSFEVEVSCESELGQTHCTTATVYPNGRCGGALAEWDGAIIDVVATCEGGNVKFTVSNDSEVNMLGSSSFIVVEDDVMTETGSFTLDALTSEDFIFPAEGQTYRLNAMQENGFPLADFATAYFEGCGTDGNGAFSIGFINDFDLGDFLSYEDIDCQENIGSYDPNDKMSFPEGFGAENLVKNNQRISYKIRFQNTGTDTAFRVVVLDTLSQLLDITTINVTSASHDYSFILRDREMRFTFDNILLVDSTKNEPASHGFITFDVDMVADLADDQLIKNSAAIYFDFNDAIITNVTQLKIGSDFIEDVSVSSTYNPEQLDVTIAPNPAGVNSILTIETPTNEAYNVEIYDVIGSRVYSDQLNGSINLAHENLEKGIYILRLIKDKKNVFSGKLIVH